MDVSENNYVEKSLLKMFWTENEVLIG